MIGKALVGLGMGATSVGMGTAFGAYQGQTEGNAAGGAAVGATVGLGLGVGAVATALNGGKIASGIGSAAVNIGAKAYNFAEAGGIQKVGSAAFKGAKVAGSTTLKGGYQVAKKVSPVASAVALKAGAKYGNIAASMFQINQDFLTKESGRMLNFSKTGKVVMGVGAVGALAVGGIKAFNQSKIGTSDGQITNATPVAPIYSSQMRNAGATGDLAFAMRAQRNG